MSDVEDCSIYFYKPSLAAAILFTVLYAIPTVFTLHRINNSRTWYFLPVVFGGVLEVAGYAIRLGSMKQPCNVALFATSQSFIVIAPLLVAAGNYIVLGRLMIAVLPVNDNHLFGLKPTLVTKVFVGIDIVSIVIQAAGSGIASSNDWEGKAKEVGVNILITGLAIQVVTVIAFLILCWKFSDRAYFGRGRRPDAPVLADRAFKAICISTALIAVRSIYRLIEFALGVEGYPFSNEWPFYVLEAVPMLFAISIFSLWYPPAYLPRNKFGDVDDPEKPNPMAGTGTHTPMMRSTPGTPMIRSTAPTPRVQSRAQSRVQSAVPSRAQSIHEQPKTTTERYA